MAGQLKGHTVGGVLGTQAGSFFRRVGEPVSDRLVSLARFASCGRPQARHGRTYVYICMRMCNFAICIWPCVYDGPKWPISLFFIACSVNT